MSYLVNAKTRIHCVLRNLRLKNYALKKLFNKRARNARFEIKDIAKDFLGGGEIIRCLIPPSPEKYIIPFMKYI